MGGFLDGILPGLDYQTRISYGIAQDALDIRTNRTGIDSAVGYFVNPRFAVQFVQTFHYVHNGIYFIFEPEFDAGVSGGGPLTPVQTYLYHDQLLRSRVRHARRRSDLRARRLDWPVWDGHHHGLGEELAAAGALVDRRHELGLLTG